MNTITLSEQRFKRIIKSYVHLFELAFDHGVELEDFFDDYLMIVKMLQKFEKHTSYAFEIQDILDELPDETKWDMADELRDIREDR